MANRDFGYHLQSTYMGQLDLSRENITRWTVAGVVTMGALLAARAMFGRKRRRKGRRS